MFILLIMLIWSGKLAEASTLGEADLSCINYRHVSSITQEEREQVEGTLMIKTKKGSNTTSQERALPGHRKDEG